MGLPLSLEVIDLEVLPSRGYGLQIPCNIKQLRVEVGLAGEQANLSSGKQGSEIVRRWQPWVIAYGVSQKVNI